MEVYCHRMTQSKDPLPLSAVDISMHVKKKSNARCKQARKWVAEKSMLINTSEHMLVRYQLRHQVM